MTTGPCLSLTGGIGIARTTFALTFIIFFKSKYFRVETKLIIICFFLNFSLGKIFIPTFGKIAKKMRSELSMTS